MLPTPETVASALPGVTRCVLESRLRICLLPASQDSYPAECFVAEQQSAERDQQLDPAQCLLAMSSHAIGQLGHEKERPGDAD